MTKKYTKEDILILIERAKPKEMSGDSNRYIDGHNQALKEYHENLIKELNEQN